MHCRAVLLLDRELQELQVEPLWGITVHKLPDSPLCLFAVLSGLKDTLWESATFHVTLQFSEHYNEEAPDVFFHTIPFHPNVHPVSGKMFSDCFEKSKDTEPYRRDQNEEFSLVNVLLTIQELLSNPVMQCAINQDAKQLLHDFPQEYDKMVQRCVSESKRLHDTLELHLLEKLQFFSSKAKESIEIIKSVPKESAAVVAILKPKQVSFDTYHKSWTQVATTKPASIAESSRNAEDRLSLTMWHPDFSTLRSLSPTSTIRVDPTNRVRSSSAIKHSDSVTKMEASRKKKLERISALKKLYLSKSDSVIEQGITAPATSMIDVTKPIANPNATESWEAEADELVAWTKSLNADKVE